MKSLKTIQVLAKIARILCLVLFIVFIVGASGCLLGLITFPLVKDFDLGEGRSLADILAENNLNYITAIAACTGGLITCGVYIFLAKYNELFFKKELNVGTPFTKEIVKDMREMALVNIITSVALTLTIGIIFTSIRHFHPELRDLGNIFGGSIGFGLAMLVLSLFCDYGAEKDEQLNSDLNN